MTRKTKYFAGVGVSSLFLAACSGGVSAPPMGTIGAPTLTSISPTTIVSTTVKVPTPPKPKPTLYPPTTTADTLVPQPVDCVQDGVNNAEWNTEADGSGDVRPLFIGSLTPPVASTGACFDKLVFTVSNGIGAEFRAEYVPVVQADGSGLPVTDIKGNVFIQLVIKAHMLRDEQGNLLYNPVDYNMPNVQGYGNLRELRLVTPDYEGYTSFGIGLDAKTPFAVESHLIGDEKTEIDVYITRPRR